MDLLNYLEAAELLRVSPYTLRRYVMEKRIPHIKPFGPHGRVFFLREDLEKFVMAHRREAVEAGPR